MSASGARPAALKQVRDEGGTVHGTSVALDGRALLIVGPPGAGKSGLALNLMALGARLISDDRTVLTARPGAPPLASAPATIAGRIEARGLGILAADPAPPGPVVAVLDLAAQEPARLPPPRTLRLAGFDVALLHDPAISHFPAALIQYLRGGRTEG